MISVQTFSNRFLKTLTEGADMMKARSLFQYFTTLTENADPLFRLWDNSIEKNVNGWEQTLHMSYRKDFPPLTAQLLFEDRY